MKKFFLLTLLSLILPVAAYAAAVEIDGIYYNLMSKLKTAEVISNPNKRYSNKIIIPETVTYDGIAYTVTSIGNEAFSNCTGLTTVIIPNSVTSIGYSAFSSTGLTSITIGDGVTSISNNAFRNCRRLSSVTIPNSVTSIGISAFDFCSGLTSIIIPNSVTSIGKWAFAGCPRLHSITIGSGVSSIDSDAFAGCSGLKQVIVSDIAAWCGIFFNGQDSNPLSKAQHLFCDEFTEITNLVIPDGVTGIGYRAFFQCIGLTSVTISNDVTIIGGEAFYGCIGLTSVSIGSSVKEIYWSAFGNCPNLTDVYCHAEQVPDIIYGSLFEGSYIDYATLHVPASAIEQYRVTAPWSDFGAIVPIGDGDMDEDAIMEVKAQPILIQTQRGIINIHGAIGGTPVSVYDANGRLCGTAVGEEDCTTLFTSFHPGSVAVVKIGEKSIKVLMK